MGKWRWGVILDAGSSGTRVHVYRWLNVAKARQQADDDDLFSLPKLETKPHYTMKIKPGVSTFGDRPADVGREHLQDLLDHALDIVPKDQVKDTPIFLMATAGMRLLDPMKQRALLDEICSYARKHSDFSLPDCDMHIQVIPGETEGLYGWIAANYLLGGFDNPDKHVHGKGHHTYGFLDMGGASAQIAFAPNSTEAEKHANDLELLRMRTLNGDASEYKVFTTTWLGFGVNQARQRYVESLLDASYTKTAGELLDPCLPSGLRTTLKGDISNGVVGKESILVGTGLFSECLAKTYPLLDKDAPCADLPCLLHGQHVPAIDFSVNHFVGVSEYWHTTHELFEMAHKDAAYDFATYQAMVQEFCSEEWHDIAEGVEEGRWGQKVTAKTAQEVCFKASWLINVLHDGIGIPRVVGGLEPTSKGLGYNSSKEVAAAGKNKGFLDPFQAVNKIDGTEVSWTLGKMVLYAAGQIPPSNVEALPVGFGSNLVSTDFQEAGSNSNPVPIQEESWTETLDEITENAHHRFSSFLFFMLFLIFIGYIFRKRERRMRFFSRAVQSLRRSRGAGRPGSPRKGGRSFFSSTKLFGRSSGNYERVLEDGNAAAAAAAEFELGSVDSDDNEHSDSSASRVGRTSGLATPKLNISQFDSGSSTYFEPGEGRGEGIGLGLTNSGVNAFDRAGLVVRTESRDRLGAPNLQMLGAGRRSRTGSPTRLKSPLMTPLGEE